MGIAIREPGVIRNRKHDLQGVVKTLNDDPDDLIPTPLLTEVIEGSEELESVQKTVVSADNRVENSRHALSRSAQRSNHLKIPVRQRPLDTISGKHRSADIQTGMLAF